MKIKRLLYSLCVIASCLVTLTACYSVSELLITPSKSSIPVGLEIQLKAEKVYTRGKVVDMTNSSEISWSSSDISIATVDSNGLVSTENTTGTVNITAIGTFNGKEFKDTVSLDVTEAVITSISLTPSVGSVPKGLSAPFTVTANLSNGELIDITHDRNVKWTSSNIEVAQVSNGNTNNGIITTHSVGSSVITASINIGDDNFAANATLEVTESIPISLEIQSSGQSLPIGLNEQFSAQVLMSDGELLEITDGYSIIWSSSNQDIAVISNTQDGRGIVTGVDVGSVSISASLQINDYLISGESTINIIDAIITSLEVRPEYNSVPIGLTKPFEVFALLSNGQWINATKESAVSWSSQDSDLATVSNSIVDKGVTTGLAIGVTKVTAFVEINGNQIKDTATIEVTEAIAMSLTVTPKPFEGLGTPQIPSNETKQFRAIVHMSDGEDIDITTNDRLFWSSDNTNIATISNNKEVKGLASGVNVGQATISAKLILDDVTFEDSTELTITLPHSIIMVVSTEYYSNTVIGNTIEYIGYSENIFGDVTIYSGQDNLNSTIKSVYVGSILQKPNSEKFYFGQSSLSPISGALRYKATFEWPDSSITEGVFEWNFDSKHYTLTDISTIKNLLKNNWDFKLTVSNEETIEYLNKGPNNIKDDITNDIPVL